MIKEKEVFRNYLRENGFKKTKQREAILDKFLASEGHICADELYYALLKKHPHIGYSTVFRTLKLLKEAQLASEVNFTGKRRRFEHKFAHEHHDHFICLSCKKTIEFSNQALEKVQARIMQEMHFEPVRHRFEIWGYCRNCIKEGRVKG